jgi:hypothetical protein
MPDFLQDSSLIRAVDLAPRAGTRALAERRHAHPARRFLSGRSIRARLCSVDDRKPPWDCRKRNPLSTQDLFDLPENVVGEIIDGRLVTHPRPAPRHARAYSSLGFELGGPFDQARNGPGGWWILDEPELHLLQHVLVPTLPAGGANACRDYPRPPGSISPPTGCARSCRPRRRASTVRKSCRSTPRRGETRLARRSRSAHPGGLREPRRPMAIACRSRRRRGRFAAAIRRHQLRARGAVGGLSESMRLASGAARAVEEAARPGWQARLTLGFERRGERTLLAHCEHHGPLRVQKALYPEGPAVCQAIVLHPPGGIAGGDRLEIVLAAGPGAHAQLTTPGAGKWYRSGGRRARQSLHVRVDEQAIVEWLPQETIVFDGAEARCRRGSNWPPVPCTVAGKSSAWGERPPASVSATATSTWRRASSRPGGRCGSSAAVCAAVRRGWQRRPAWRPAGQRDAAARRRAVERNGSRRAARCRSPPGLRTGVTALPDVLVARCLAPGREPAKRLVGRGLEALAAGGAGQASRAAAHLEYLIC